MKKETLVLSVVAVVLVFFAGAFFSSSLVTGKQIYGQALTSEQDQSLYSCKRLYDVTTTGDAACAGLSGGFACVDDSEVNMPTARVVVDAQHDDLRRDCSFNWAGLEMCPGDVSEIPTTGMCLNGPPTVLCCR